MNATKRKFNALLQGLSSPRPSSSENNNNNDNMSATSRYGSSIASNDEILRKRQRLGFPESTAPTLYSKSSLVTSFSTVVLKKPSAPSGIQTTSRAPAKYCPGDRDELLKRLATFQEITDWTPKPDKVSEIEWAKRGWICQGREKVRCVLCHKELIVKLNKKEIDGKEVTVLVSSEIAEALVEKYSHLIISSHQQDCLWRKRGCDDSLIRLSFSNTHATLASLRQRYDELCSRSPFLPYEFNLRLPEDMSVNDVLSQLPADFFTEPPPIVDTSCSVAERSPNRPALALALMGWQGLTNPRIGTVPNSASCHTCLRRLGLWMFKSKEVDEEGQVVAPAPMDHLDPLREHRFFCPWKNAHAQRRAGARTDNQPDLAGWKTLIQTVKNESDLRNVYSGRSRKIGQLQGEGTESPSVTRGAPSPPVCPTPQMATPKKDTEATDIVSSRKDEDENEDEKARDAKDKERWARLRRVKSLFNTKGSRKTKRDSARSGTGYSNNSSSAK